MNASTLANERKVRLVPVLSGRQQTLYFAGIGLWLCALVFFWSWWLQLKHMDHVFLFGVVTFAMGWATLLPAYFMAHYARARKPAPGSSVPRDLRVAMVVTKAPSEPWSIVTKTLEAMLAQDYPHDTWLADEDPSPEALAWCAARGVQVSSRHGQEDYHRKTWPRRTRCKEGNLAFFYDHYGYENYEFVAQLDADHVPEKSYLKEMLRPFSDERVGYVSAPSICDSNAASSWSARGRLHAEGSMHGALQAGYTAFGAPLCIGSHYAVRTAALREIGGLGPELAEDHSTTMLMVAHGWRGAHALEAIAHGEGPKTFADLITQEFQWSRSIVTILLRYSPTYLPRMPLGVRAMFTFSQLWYPLFSLFAALGFLLPIFALVFNVTYANVSFADFVIHSLPVALVLVLVAHQWRSHGTFRPWNARITSWEAVIFYFTRWPWSLLGCLAAVKEWLTDKEVDFRVTPKGATDVDPLPLRVLAPYAILSIASALPCLLVDNAVGAAGFYVFAAFNAVLYAGILLLIVRRHGAENRVRATNLRAQAVVGAMLAACLVSPVLAVSVRGMEGLHALSQGAPLINLTQLTYSPSGAGQGAVAKIQFNPEWKP